MGKKTYHTIGLMSGTSLDGLDICYVSFEENNFKIHKTITITYENIWLEKLANAHTLNGFALMQLNHDFGVLCGQMVTDFVADLDVDIDFISSHGHTVFHSPGTGFTTQIGSGAAIFAVSGIKTICDFRSLDVALGGQGAPLVPIGDLLLFKQYEACLNLGGISNVSLKTDSGIIAQDLGYCNLLLNFWVKKHFGVVYDKGGEMGRGGNINIPLLNSFLEFTALKEGKSLAREDFEDFIKLIPSHLSHTDVLRTSYEYIATYLGIYLNFYNVREVLATGGGAHNTFLIELIQSKTNTKVLVPDKEIVDFKEALVFAYLGLLRVEYQVNCLATVTNAKANNVGGAIWG